MRQFYRFWVWKLLETWGHVKKVDYCPIAFRVKRRDRALERWGVGALGQSSWRFCWRKFGTHLKVRKYVLCQSNNCGDFWGFFSNAPFPQRPVSPAGGFPEEGEGEKGRQGEREKRERGSKGRGKGRWREEGRDSSPLWMRFRKITG